MPTLTTTAADLAARLVAAGIAHAVAAEIAPGAARVSVPAEQARAASAALIQAGYNVSTHGGTLTVCAPEPAADGLTDAALARGVVAVVSRVDLTEKIAAGDAAADLAAMAERRGWALDVAEAVRDGRITDRRADAITARAAEIMDTTDEALADLIEPAEEAPRVTVTHSGDGTTAEAHGGRDDEEARAALKAAGFRWSRNLGAWFLPRTWQEHTRAGRVRQLAASLPGVVVDDQGPDATRTAAEREQEQRERAEARAERLDGRAERLHAESDRRAQTAHALADAIPFGQPILIGHHSEGRHRRDLARINANDRASWEAQKEATRSEERAETARRTAAGPSSLARLRRIERNEAEARGVARRLAGLAEGEAPGYRARLEAIAARLADEIAHDRAEVEASGRHVFTPADVKRGDLVQYRGRWHKVVRVNRTTVSVETGYSWTDRLELHQVTAVKTPEQAAG